MKNKTSKASKASKAKKKSRIFTKRKPNCSLLE